MRTWILLPSFILTANLYCGCSHAAANPMAQDECALSAGTPVSPLWPKGTESPASTPASANVLTLTQAIGPALRRNPGLRACSWDIRAAEARRLQAGLRPHPEVALDVESFGGGGAALVLERTQAVPDPALFAGIRRLAEEDDEQNLAAAYDEGTALRSQVLPGAKNACEAARESYGKGRFDYLTVPDAQRTWFDTQRQCLEAPLSHHTARVDLDRLTLGPGRFDETPDNGAIPGEAIA